MNRAKAALLSLLLLIGACLAGCSKSPLDLPVKQRQANYANGGSCAWACLVTLLRSHDDVEQASYIRKHYSGSPVFIFEGHKFTRNDMATALDRLGVGHVEIAHGDAAWLKAGCEAGGCVAVVNFWDDGRGHTLPCKPAEHAVVLVSLDEQATWIDPNYPATPHRGPAKAFLFGWQKSGGLAIYLKDSWQL